MTIIPRTVEFTSPEFTMLSLAPLPFAPVVALEDDDGDSDEADARDAR